MHEHMSQGLPELKFWIGGVMQCKPIVNLITKGKRGQEKNSIDDQ
jgi:hypothetical protein